jgi:hypothetical protein
MKGHTNNPNGRPKNVPNRITSELRSMLHDFITEQWQSIKMDFERLEPKERLIYYEKLLQYVLPKNKVEVDTITERPIFNGIDLDVENEIEKIRIFELPNNHRKNEN